MQFDSIQFLIFLPAIFLIISISHDTKTRNLILLLASYLFYSFWDYRFLLLIVTSSLIDYYSSLQIEKGNRKYLYLSLIVNLGALAYFKYFNFFISSINDTLQLVGLSSSLRFIEIILPVGISFYTFQTLSYTIDVYYNRIKAEKSLVDFFLYVSFFPQLVAGPIERASRLIPQLKCLNHFNYDKTRIGFQQILYGFMLKIILADGSAIYVNQVFEKDLTNGLEALIGSIMFSFQIYGDFAGYSLIAIGIAKILGIDLMQNFNRPYLSHSITDFWRNWHISLSTWFKDYLYIPLGGPTKLYRNILIVFLISGLWHGANYTFIVWGLGHGILILIERKFKLENFGIYKYLIFPTVTLLWIFFRAENIEKAIQIVVKIFEFNSYSDFTSIPKTQLILIITFIVWEFIQKNASNPLEIINRISNRLTRDIIYSIIIISLFLSKNVESQFIYFQF